MLRVGLGAVEQAPGGEGPADRLRGNESAVRVPEAAIVGEVADAVFLVAVGVVGAIDQRRRKAARAGRRGENEIERRSALGLDQLRGIAAGLELESAPIGIGNAANGLGAGRPPIG